MMRKMPMGRIDELFAAIERQCELYLPILRKGRVDFSRRDPGDKVRLGALNTAKSAKDLFFPQSEELMSFQMRQKNISVTPGDMPDRPFVLFGVRACDVRSFGLLDMVFLSEPVDTYYRARRQNGTVVALACAEPEETCFCPAFGIDATEPEGDVAAWMTDGWLYWQPRTAKGEKLIESVAELFEEADAEELKKSKEAVRAILDRLPLRRLKTDAFGEGALKELFDSPVWGEVSKACIGCGTCTFVCPTCHCYDIRDFDAGDRILRYRCWDSCMYSDFTMMAHGNPRKTQLERFRQRFMHKLVYFPENNGGVCACVGCGRCISKCPVSMNIVKVIKAMEASGDGK